MMTKYILLILLVIAGSYAVDYNFDHVITLKKDSFDQNHWESSEITPSGWLQYNMSSVDKSSEFSIMVMDYENLVLYENGKPYYVFSEYSKYNTKTAYLNRTFIQLEKNFFVVIENENIISSITVDVLISYQQHITPPPSPVNVESLVIVIIILLISMGVIGITLVVYFGMKRCKRSNYVVVTGELQQTVEK